MYEHYIYIYIYIYVYLLSINVSVTMFNLALQNVGGLKFLDNIRV